MTSEIVHSEKNSLILDSGLSDSAFGKTNMGTLLDEQGWIANIPSAGCRTDEVTFAPYIFSETRTEDNHQVTFAGPAFEGKTLHEIFIGANPGFSSQTESASCAAVLALTAAIAQHINLAPVGIGGIICAETQVLFLPGILFDRCALNTSDSQYSELQGQSLRRGLTGVNALAFTRAVIAYRSLCGALPYTELNTDRRQADMIDADFVPSALIVNGIAKDTASAIDAGLKIAGEMGNEHGRTFKSKKEEAREQAEKKASEEFPLESYRRELSLSANANTPAGTAERRALELPPDLFDSRRTRYLARRRVTITLSRFTRRNRNMILAVVIAVIAALSASRGFHKENEKLATSVGLTSEQTVETLYTGIHHADVTIVQEIAKGGKMKDLIQMVSGFYVTAKQRQSLDQANGTVSPAAWMFFKGESNFWMYGMTNFTVDGIDASTSYKYPTRKNHPPAITSDTAQPAAGAQTAGTSALKAGAPLKNGDTVTHESSYYLVHSDSDYRININKTTDTVTLTWKGNRWIATSITGKSENSDVNTKKFRADYEAAIAAAKTAALAGTSGTVQTGAPDASSSVNDGALIAAAVESLRSSYPWLPRPDELRAGAQESVKSFNSSAAKEYLAD